MSLRALNPSSPWFALAVVSILCLGFGLLADEVMEGSTQALDSKIVSALRSGQDLSLPIGPPWLRSVARDVTALGSVTVLSIIVFIVVGYLSTTEKRISAWLVLGAVSGGAILNSLLKHEFARARPDYLLDSAKLVTASFPSGHAALSAITYLTLAALLSRTTKSRRMKLYFVTVAVLLVLMIGVSRVYLGVHYPTDVLAGWCLGSAWALTCWAIFSRLQREGQAEPPDGR